MYKKCVAIKQKLKNQLIRLLYKQIKNTHYFIEKSIKIISNNQNKMLLLKTILTELRIKILSTFT